MILSATISIVIVGGPLYGSYWVGEKKGQTISVTY